LGTVTYESNGDKNFGKNASRSLEAACPLGWTTNGSCPSVTEARVSIEPPGCARIKATELNGRLSLLA